MTYKRTQIIIFKWPINQTRFYLIKESETVWSGGTAVCYSTS